MPSKLKVLLICWTLVGLLWFIYSGTFSYINIAQLINGSRQDRSPSTLVVLPLFTLFGLYLLKICYDLWRKKQRAVLPLKIFAGLILLGVPLGTVLGIFTFNILGSSEVKAYLKNS